MRVSQAATGNAASDPVSRNGVVLAFDFGERRVGIAVGDLGLRIAHLLETLDSRDGGGRFARIAALVDEWKPTLFVVGLPVGVDGSEHPLAVSVRRFAAELTRRFGIETRFVDERFTSAEASHMLSEAGVRGRKQKAFLDQVAARTILEDFFSHADIGA